jgi:TonB family protein
MLRQTDPRSPVQDTRDPAVMALLGFALAFGAFMGWQHRDTLVDLYDGEYWTDHDGPRRAQGDLMAIFSTDDYPSSAIRREEQGTVAYRLQIDRRGRVGECRIIQSSGSEALDRATCDILSSRARFNPARNSEGQRVEDEYSGRIRWELPEE